MSLKKLDWIPDRVCWPRTECGSCLDMDVNCLWCPFSNVCMPPPPNTPFPLILAGVHNSSVCPMLEERYEIRTKTFSCAISTTTVVSTGITTVLALVFLLLISIIIARHYRRYYKRLIMFNPSAVLSDSSDSAQEQAIYAVPTPITRLLPPPPSRSVSAPTGTGASSVGVPSILTIVSSRAGHTADEPALVSVQPVPIEDERTALLATAGETAKTIKSSRKRVEEQGLLSRLFNGCTQPAPPSSTGYQSAASEYSGRK